MKQAALYARVSTDKQEQQRTIESQLAELREVCRGNQIPIVQEYIDDGCSGSRLQRPGLDSLRDDAPKGLFQAIYILSPDRLARKYAYQVLVIEELRKTGVEVVFMNQPVTDKPEDQLLLGIQGIIAEYERAQIMERTRRGKLHRSRQGEMVTGQSAIGYDFIKKTREAPARWAVNEKEAELVRLIFRLYLAQGKNTAEVAMELINRGIKTRTGLTKWQPNTIYRILTNETYIGRAYYNKCEGKGVGIRVRDRSEWILIPVAPIIDEAAFQLAQRVLKSHRRRVIGPEHRLLRNYIFSGLLRCHYCGSRYSGFLSGGKYPYYRCMNWSRMKPLPRTCRAGAVRAEQLEQSVMAALRDLVTTPDILRQYLLNLSGQIQRNTGNPKSQRNRLEQQRTSLEQKQQRLLDLYLEGQISKEDYAARKTDLAGKLVELEQSRSEIALAPKIDEASIDQAINELVRLAQDKLESLTSEEQAVFLRQLVDQMLFDYKERTVKIVGHLPVGEQGEFLHPTSGAQTPYTSCKNLWEFELEIRVIGRRYARWVNV